MNARVRFVPPCLAALLALSVVVVAPHARAESAAVEAATNEQSTTASDKYRAGADAFEAQKLPEALALFRESYAIVASPNSHLMIARVLAKMGKNADAYNELEATIREADLAASKSDKYKKTAQTARSERDELKAKVGFLVVGVDANFSVGGRRLGADEIGRTLVVEPGSTEVVLRTAAGTEEHRRVDVPAGQEIRVAIAPPTPATPTAPAPAAPCPPPVQSSPATGIDQRLLAGVAGGIGIVGLATFAVFGTLDQKKYSDLESKCPNGICSRSLAGDAETGRTYQTLANVGLGVGVVGIATGLVLIFTAPHPPKTEKSARAAFTNVRVGPSSVTVVGNF